MTTLVPFIARICLPLRGDREPEGARAAERLEVGQGDDNEAHCGAAGYLSSETIFVGSVVDEHKVDHEHGEHGRLNVEHIQL